MIVSLEQFLVRDWILERIVGKASGKRREPNPATVQLKAELRRE